MNDVVIQVENLSKQYRLGEVSTGSLHHDINRWWHKVRGLPDPYLSVTGENIRTRKVEKRRRSEDGRGRGTTENAEHAEGDEKTLDYRPSTLDSGKIGSVPAGDKKSLKSKVQGLMSDSDYVWALRDINFEVKRGEVLGVIGRNGAGKSTLLKIMSRITAPTTGEVRVKGRIGALLEVGTGFHQDLTGRENIYLNGAVLGMTKAEIAAKLDEIVEFSGCARYIDTPVKRYSSGMVVRLGFAVAAHLEPEILIVDEVLAVGDAEFQKKCIGKMQDVASHGRTVLFVSHNMGAIRSLCTKVCVLTNGGLSWMGDTEEGIQHYLMSCMQEQSRSFKFVGSGKQFVEIDFIRINGHEHSPDLLPSEDIIVDVVFFLRISGRYRFYLSLLTEHGVRLFSHSTDYQDLTDGRKKVTFKLDAYFLRPGKYVLGFGGNEFVAGWFYAADVATLTILKLWSTMNPEGNHGIINYPSKYSVKVVSADEGMEPSVVLAANQNDSI